VEAVSPPAASEAVEAVSPPAASEAVETIDLDDVIVAWGAIISDLAPATRSAVQNAQPVSVDGDVLVFGVPPEMLGAARERFKREADTVREALAGRLGKRFKFSLVADEQVSLSGASRAPAAGGPTPAAAPDDSVAPPHDPVEPRDQVEPRDLGEPHDLVEEDVRPEELVDAPPDVDAAPVSRLRAELGATVVEELPRES